MSTTPYISPTLGIPLYTSRTHRQVAVGRPEKLMSYGDRISVRVVVECKTVFQYQTRQVADMTDLTGDLRQRAKGMKGLATVTIRNHDRGWMRELHIKLYPKRTFASAQRVEAVPVPMFFPWEL